MNKYKEVSKEEVFKMFYDLQTKFWNAGCWRDGFSVEFLAHRMKTSTYQIRKAYKQLAEEGYLKLEKIPTAFEEYDMGFSLYPTTTQPYDEMAINVENKLSFKILGNIYDNPELLDESEENKCGTN